jgi:hypothetical protein
VRPGAGAHLLALRRPVRHRRAASSAHAVTTVASDSAARAPSSGASSPVERQLLGSSVAAACAPPRRTASGLRSSRAAELSRRWATAQRHAARRHQQSRQPDFERVDEIARERREGTPAEGEPGVAVKAPAHQLEVVGGQERAAGEHQRRQPRRDRDDAPPIPIASAPSSDEAGPREPQARSERPVRSGRSRSSSSACAADPTARPNAASAPQERSDVDLRRDRLRRARRSSGARGCTAGAAVSAASLRRPAAERVEGRPPGGGEPPSSLPGPRHHDSAAQAHPAHGDVLHTCLLPVADDPARPGGAGRSRGCSGRGNAPPAIHSRRGQPPRLGSPTAV